ncbi:MAG: hypothetical protein GC159_18770 [Phycisphaera sp.]|nr:hypothetical protein [Phycisphaera sp.]
MKRQRSEHTACRARLASAVVLATLLAAATSHAQDPGWPREFQSEGHRVIVYQPQADSWENHKRLGFLAAVEVIPPKGGRSVYGVIDAEAETFVDFTQRVVLVRDLKSVEIRFVNVPA